MAAGRRSQIAQTRQRRNDTPDNYHRSSDMSNSFVIENNICRNSWSNRVFLVYFLFETNHRHDSGVAVRKHFNYRKISRGQFPEDKICWRFFATEQHGIQQNMFQKILNIFFSIWLITKTENIGITKNWTKKYDSFMDFHVPKLLGTLNCRWRKTKTNIRS